MAVPGTIQWRRFLPIALPLGLLSGLLGILGLIGLPALVAAVIFGINRYRRHHSGPITRRTGALLGAVIALIAVPPLALIEVAGVMFSDTVHQEMIQKANESAAQSPELRNFAEWVATREGFTVVFTVVLLFYLAFILLLGAVTGAMAAGSGKNRK